MSKPAFSFGLKKSVPSRKPAPNQRRPATFGADESDGARQPTDLGVPIEEISEIGGVIDEPSASQETEAAKSQKHGIRSLKKGGALPEPPSRKPRPAGPATAPPQQLGDLSSALEARKHAQAAEAADPSIYDYDGIYDSLKLPQKKKQQQAAAEAEADAETGEARRPRYFDALQRAADVRERDRQIAEERRLQRERAAEGEAFADKEKFVTEAYRRQQEENRRREAEEKRREEEERQRNEGKGMTDFYRKMLLREEQLHAEKMAAVAEAARHPRKEGRQPGEKEENNEAQAQEEEEDQDQAKTEAELAREINEKGGHVVLNEDGEVVDKRQLLRGGLNVGARKAAAVQRDKARQEAAHSGVDGLHGRSKGVYAAGGKQAARERQTRMLEAQLEASLKRAREEEEEEERLKIEAAAKSRKTEADISSAKERYLARKRAAEEAKKKGIDVVP